jgi:hypothetical protein
MGFLDSNKLSIAFKKLLGKAHTQESFAVSEEGISSNISISYATIFGNQIDPNPATSGGLTSLYDNDGVVERVRFEVERIPDTEVGLNQSQGYRLKLPSDYTVNGYLGSIYSGGTLLHTKLGKLQVVPSLYGELKLDGSTEYDPTLYQTDGITEITKFDPINWGLDFYNGVLFIQDPFTGFDVSANRPGYLDAFLYVGDYLDDIVFSGGTTGNTQNNKKEINIVTSTGYTVIDSDSYIGCSGVTSIILPSTPKLGHEVTFSDIIGDAYTNNVQINGNGYNIQDDTFALINTDYGSLTLVFNGIIWSGTAIVS